MNCGEAIHVKDFHGIYVTRFIAQCGDRFMLISHNTDYRNGYMLSDWTTVLRELVAAAVPDKLTEHVKVAERVGNGSYVSIPLTYPLSVKGLADLLGIAPDAVRECLSDLAVIS